MPQAVPGRAGALPLRRCAATLAVAGLTACAAPAKLADPARVRSLWEGDADCVAAARAHGHHLAGADAQVWIEPGAAWAAAYATRIDAGVRVARSYLAGQGLDSPAPVEVYVCDRKVISHAPGGPFVFVARALAEEGKAPWLHETMHVLLRGGGPDWLTDFDEATAARDMPLWLVEGTTEYVAEVTSETAGLDNSGPFSAKLEELDAVCARAAQAGPADVLETIGRAGRPADWFGPDRFRKAQVFYPCATSFVAWLARRHGLPTLLRAQRATPIEQTVWETSAKASLELERRLWLEHLWRHR